MIILAPSAGVGLALVDDNFHPNELRWLLKIAHFNGLANRWLDAVIREIQEKNPDQSKAPFEI